MSRTFVQYRETNDNEGEIWSWWLQVNGNEAELARLDAYLVQEDDNFIAPDFESTNDVEPEGVVDILVDHAESGYFDSHNKVTGVLTLPDSLDDENYIELYKGAIRDYFKESK